MSGSRMPTRSELEERFPKEEFPDELAWRVTVDVYLEGSGTCISCDDYVAGPFNWDCVGFDGVCSKHKLVVPNGLHFPCPDGID